MSMRALWLAVLAIGCGGGASSTPQEATAVMGTFLGKTFVATNAVSYSATDYFGTVGIVVISTSEALCSSLQAGHLPPESHNLVLHVFDTDVETHTTAPTSAGQYMVTDVITRSARLAGASYVETDAGCGYLKTRSGVTQTGRVTLTGADSGAYSGSFSIMMPAPDLAAGTIKSELCPGAGLVVPAPRC